MKTQAKVWLGFVSCMMGWWLVGASVAVAQSNYPVKPIRVLIPFPAAGAADTVGRTLGEHYTAAMGQAAVIDNRPGAGGRLAVEMLAKAEPNGYTLLVGVVGGIAISPALYRKLPYNVERDLLAVTRLAEVINVMVVPAATGVKSVKEFIGWARKRGGDMRYGSSGPGQPDHLAGEIFQRLTGLQMTHVPYKGGGPALVDLVAGDLQVMFPTYIVAAPHIQSGRLRPLAVTPQQRQSLLDLPTVAESVPGFDVSNWQGLFVPAKTPRHIVERLFVETNKALKAAEVKKRFNASGMEPVGSPSQENFAKFVIDETTRWARVVKDAGVQVE